MKTQAKKLFQVYLFVVIALMIPCGSVFADDLNPPAYRGDPLSVYAHWLDDATGSLTLDQFLWVDDDEPTTVLHPLLPLITTSPIPGASNGYQIEVPNIIDELPLKLLRLQLTWEGTTQPPINVDPIGNELGQNIQGFVTFASNPLVFTQPDGGYQYFDIEFCPNPDFEYLQVFLAPDAHLVQVVVDSVSTIPEPATLALLTLGGVVMTHYRNNNRNC